MAEQARPLKRRKTSESGPPSLPLGFLDASKIGHIAREQALPGQESRGILSARDGRTRRPQKDSQDANRPKSLKTFSQPSAICAGDKGIFVSSDKGREKKCLLELHDLLQQYLDRIDIDVMGNPASHALEDHSMDTPKDAAAVTGHENTGIEADIASELAELRGTDPGEADTKSTVSKPMQLITLEIPCVSFLRFPAGSSIDPADVVHKLCLDAAAPSSQQKSRYIKRLTAISRLGKALSQGLEKVCDEVLPHYFGPPPGRDVESIKFAIRPTIRNNDKLDRDQVIKTVATKIQEVGENKHKVDLKQCEKAVLVEVYRGWVGICVVDNTSSGAYRIGYEGLKRFNLAEIYASK